MKPNPDNTFMKTPYSTVENYQNALDGRDEYLGEVAWFNVQRDTALGRDPRSHCPAAKPGCSLTDYISTK